MRAIQDSTLIVLFLAVLGYGIFGGVIGYYLIGKFTIFWIMSIAITLFALYQYTKPKLYPHARYGVVFARFGSIFVGIAFVYQLIFSGLLFQEPVVAHKNQLTQIQTTIPQKSTTIRSSKRHISFLELNNQRFRCLENDRDTCPLVYDFYTQNATVLYYHDRYHGNIIYEIKIGDNYIYHFDKQRNTLIKNRKKLLNEFLLVILFYLLPAILFWLVDKRISADIPIATEEENKKEEERQQRIYSHMDTGEKIIQGIGTLGASFGFVILLIFWIQGEWVWVVLMTAIIIGCCFLIYLPSKNATDMDNNLQNNPNFKRQPKNPAYFPKRHNNNHPVITEEIPINKLNTTSITNNKTDLFIEEYNEYDEYEDEDNINLTIIYYFNIFSWILLLILGITCAYALILFVYMLSENEVDFFIKLIYFSYALFSGFIIYKVINHAHNKRELLFDDYELTYEDLEDYPIKSIFGDWLFIVGFFGAILSVIFAIWAYFLDNQSMVNNNLINLSVLVVIMFTSRFFRKYR